MLKITYWHDKDICGFIYSTGYKNRMYFNEIVTSRDFALTEEGTEDGDLEFYSAFSKIVTEYKTSPKICTLRQWESLEQIALHKFIEIELPNGQKQLVKYFKVDASFTENEEYVSVRLSFQVRYEIARSRAENVDLECDSKLLKQVTRSIAGLTTPPSYSGERVVFSNAIYRGQNGTWVNTNELKAENYFFNVESGRYLYYTGSVIYEDARILTATLVSGSNYRIRGLSRIGYISIEYTSDGGATWQTLKQGTSGQFKGTGILCTLTSAMDSIRAVSYTHGCLENIGRTFANPIATEFIEIVENLTDFETSIGLFSTSQSFTIEKINSTTDCVITAPTGFEVSTDDLTFSTSVTVADPIPLTNIYVRMTGATSGSVSGNITLVVNSKTYRIAIAGDVLCSIQWILDELEIINGEVVGDVYDNLEQLKTTKLAIKTAIEGKGVIVGTAPFSEYPSKIDDIQWYIWQIKQF